MTAEFEPILVECQFEEEKLAATAFWHCCRYRARLDAADSGHSQCLNWAPKAVSRGTDHLSVAPALAALDAFAEPGRPRRQAIAAYCHAA